MEKIHKDPKPLGEKIADLYQLLLHLLKEMSSDEQIHFTTTFARMAYLGNRFQLDRNILFGMHSIRKRIEVGAEENYDQRFYQSCLYVLAHAIKAFFKHVIPYPLKDEIPASHGFIASKLAPVEFKKTARIIIVSGTQEEKKLEFFDQQDPANQRVLIYGQLDRNELFTGTLSRLVAHSLLPITAQLFDVEVDSEGIYYPGAIIIEPDFLVDVTGIAECFNSRSNDPRLYLLRRFLPIDSSMYLMLGHIANDFLDQLIANPSTRFSELRKSIFRLNPLAFALFDDGIVKELIQRSYIHYANLRKVVITELSKKRIKDEDLYIEPSFFSEKYGIQGRLDLFHQGEQQNDIIELKSGKIFRPNAYGLNQNHYIQTILYDLLTEYITSPKHRTTGYILYSGIESKNLRFAPSVKSVQHEALAVRNVIVETDYYLAEGKESILRNLFSSINLKSFPKASGFLKNDVERFQNAYGSLSELERKYFHRFASFITNELLMAKIGNDEKDQLNGLASIWLNTEEDKVSQFNILNRLQILNIDRESEKTIVYLQKIEATAAITNFRQGDIAVFYPVIKGKKTGVSSQVFKCTIIELGEHQLTIRLRSQQKNLKIFNTYSIWNLEHDVLDSGFNMMFRNLFEFAASDQSYRDLILGIRPPSKANGSEIHNIPSGLNEEQQSIFKSILRSNDYYLLWGPPGTGKTSRMIKHLVNYIFEQTDEYVLLLAYTNRAVDEICDAILSIAPSFRGQILRVGSKYSVDRNQVEFLLQSQLEAIDNRKELLKFLKSKRIYLGTVASVQGKRELFKILKFDRVIIDEASQILEPNLIGLLSNFRHVVFVGDHRQLPAVVAQNPVKSKIKDGDLNAIGLTDTRNSLFERLYLTCLKNGWDHAIGQLSIQGRMHEQIMAFVNQNFYNERLSVFRDNPSLQSMTPLVRQNKVLKSRTLFLPVKNNEIKLQSKTNENEADLVVKIAQQIFAEYQMQKKPFTLESLGIITPFRAQIAMIRKKIEMHAPELSEITVDTVERYQGGARDVIIYSFCINHKAQFKAISSISYEGVDRKLNVALSRAREQMILIGNEFILEKNKLYHKLISSYTQVDPKKLSNSN